MLPCFSCRFSLSRFLLFFRPLGGYGRILVIFLMYSVIASCKLCLSVRSNPVRAGILAFSGHQSVRNYFFLWVHVVVACRTGELLYCFQSDLVRTHRAVVGWRCCAGQGFAFILRGASLHCSILELCSQRLHLASGLGAEGFVRRTDSGRKRVSKLNTLSLVVGSRFVEKARFFAGMYIAFSKRCFGLSII